MIDKYMMAVTVDEEQKYRTFIILFSFFVKKYN